MHSKTMEHPPIHAIVDLVRAYIYKQTTELYRSIISSSLKHSQSPSLAECVLTEIGGGNLNYIFRVALTFKRVVDAHDPNTVVECETCSVIVKYSPPYIKCLGPSFQLPVARLGFEYRAMKIMQDVMPTMCPRPLHYSCSDSMLAMEDLADLVDMRTALMSQELHTDLPATIGTMLACIHNSTHRNTLSTVDFEAQRVSFDNSIMTNITADYVFTKPFCFDDTTNRISVGLEHEVSVLRANVDAKLIITEARKRFLTVSECLVHGDLHTGSMMVRLGSGTDIRFIDSEFAFVGPAGFDVALVVANLLLAYAAHRVQGHEHFMKRLLAGVEDVWISYSKSFRAPALLKALERDVLHMGGCEVLRRLIGAAHVADVESIVNDTQRLRAECLGIKIGTKMLFSQSLNEVIQYINNIKT